MEVACSNWAVARFY